MSDGQKWRVCRTSIRQENDVQTGIFMRVNYDANIWRTRSRQCFLAKILGVGCCALQGGPSDCAFPSNTNYIARKATWYKRQISTSCKQIVRNSLIDQPVEMRRQTLLIKRIVRPDKTKEEEKSCFNNAWWYLARRENEIVEWRWWSGNQMEEGNERKAGRTKGGWTKTAETGRPWWAWWQTQWRRRRWRQRWRHSTSCVTVTNNGTTMMARSANFIVLF